MATNRLGLKSLYDHAGAIPSMGGAKLGPLLRDAGRSAPANTALVEIGCWLGAGTAQLAIGIRERQRQDVRLHCYDRWQASKSEVEKAAKKGWRLKVGEDTLPRTRAALAPFEIPINFHKGDLRDAAWSDGPISVYVDDASKIPILFCHALEIFAPHWIAGETLVFLMDFDFWRKSGWSDHMCQKRFIEAHADAFERTDSDHAVFRYTKKADFTAWIESERFGARFAAPIRTIARRLQRLGRS